MDSRDRFDGDKLYGVEGATVRRIADLMDRLYSEQRMDAEEMRDWGNILNAHLRYFVVLDESKL